ncbi:hypothetical protein C8F04DRAFT_1344341 [Mycena alexandri]|uniref:Uncharacterized protein n=1 Tax=Mycena alexandri TaxID=1745969 RepID=A0AAD6SX67_9AGAR|nr:hypothetical protein C8F04DRAFT_1344341 [Mycena alexandri]
MAWSASSSYQRPRPVVVTHTARHRARTPVPVQVAAHTHIGRPVAPMSIHPRPSSAFYRCPATRTLAFRPLNTRRAPCLDLQLINSFSPGTLMNAAANYCISVSQDASFIPFFTSSAHAFFCCRIEILCPLLCASPSARRPAPAPSALHCDPLPISAATRGPTPPPLRRRASAYQPPHSLRTYNVASLPQSNPRRQRTPPRSGLYLRSRPASARPDSLVHSTPPNATNAMQTPPTKLHTFRSRNFAPRSACTAWLMQRAANATTGQFKSRICTGKDVSAIESCVNRYRSATANPSCSRRADFPLIYSIDEHSSDIFTRYDSTTISSLGQLNDSRPELLRMFLLPPQFSTHPLSSKIHLGYKVLNSQVFPYYRDQGGTGI